MEGNYWVIDDVSFHLQEPIAFGKWVSELDASVFRSVCPQLDLASNNVIGQEDCLFLNIFTPYELNVAQHRIEKSTNDLLPVMVWFHGGGFVRGSSTEYAPHLVVKENVLLVTVNYRLGILGNLLVKH